LAERRWWNERCSRSVTDLVEAAPARSAYTDALIDSVSRRGRGLGLTIHIAVTPV